ncbi:MAG: exosortase [Longimicrobiales bacterium]|nr:exosortase [Longimicrobiales bacterium]
MDSPQTLQGPERIGDATEVAQEAPEEGRPMLGLILLTALAAFFPTVASFPPTWNASYQEHGFFVGGLVLWLLWRDRHRIMASAGKGIPDLLPVLGLLSLTWLFAMVMNVRLVHQLVFWAIATTGALALFGWRARRPILVTAATFLLAIPFWSVFTPVLQRMTTIMSGAIAKAGGVEAVIREDTISISTGTFLVESGCSGMNYLMGGLVLGAFYAHLFTDRWQTQAKIVAVAGAMSIIGNWIRVAVLVFLGEATAMQSPYIEDHLWQGWAIFTLLMIPTYFIARQIEERDAARYADGTAGESRDEAPGAESTETGESWMEAEGTDATAADAPAQSPTPQALRRRALQTVAVAVVGPVLFYVVGALPRGGEVERDPGIFGLAPEWTVAERDARSSVWGPDFQGYDERALWTARGPQGTVHAARYYFQDQRQGEELIQYNNRIAADSLMAADRIIGPIGPEGRFVHEAVVRDAESPRVVWYWYRVGGFDTPFEFKAKLLEIVAFFRRLPAAELVVLDAVCAPDDCTDAAMALRAATGVPIQPSQDTSAPSATP